VEIDEAYIGGGLRHHGSKVAKASKTMVIGMAERCTQASIFEMALTSIVSRTPLPYKTLVAF
jgi:hypothetical protein